MKEQDKGTQSIASYNANLILSDDINAPAAFSPEIASISLRTPSNFLDDGFALRLTSTFGADEVELETESLIFTVRLEILQARIELDFANCKPTFGAHYHDHMSGAEPEKKTETSIKYRSVSRSGGNSEANLKLNESARPSASVTGSAYLTGEGTNDRETISSISRNNTNYRHSSIDRVIIGSFDAGVPLKDVEIGDYEGWKVFPNLESRSGVLATLKVKSNWLKIDKIDSEVKPNGASISPQLAEWLANFRRASSVRRDLFKLLLQNLVHLKLQNAEEKTYATLDCSVLCVEPGLEEFVTKGSDHIVKNLSLRDQIFEAFVSASDDQEARRIAEEPARYMLPEPIYEFPLCCPAELLEALGIGLPIGSSGKTWAQAPIKIATMSEIERDISYLKIPTRYNFTFEKKVDKSISDPVAYIRKRVSRVPVIAAAIQDIGLMRFEEGEPVGLLGKVFSRKSDRQSVIRRRLDSHFVKMFQNRLSSSEINMKVTLASMWVEFVKDDSWP